MKKLINNDSQKAYSKDEARIIEIIIEHGINPMAAPNCATEIIEYVNEVYIQGVRDGVKLEKPF